MEKWRACWREWIGPKLPLSGLRALADGLLHDDPRLTQHSHDVLGSFRTSNRERYNGARIVGACAIGYAVWRGLHVSTQEVFNRTLLILNPCPKSHDMDHWEETAPFWNWFDGECRSVMRRALLPEVNRSIALWTRQLADEVINETIQEVIETAQ